MADATESEIQATVIDIWSEILKAKDIGPEDDFFKLGADSLHAESLMMHVEERFDLVMDSNAIFDAPTVSSFSAEIARAMRADGTTEAGVEGSL